MTKINDQPYRRTGHPEFGRCSTERWIWGLYCTLATKHASEGIHAGFEIQGRHHKKFKTGVSVVSQKGQMPCKTRSKTIPAQF